MFHNQYTISIGQLAMLMESHDFNLIKRYKIPLPKYMMKKAYLKMVKEVNETLNKSALEKELESGILKTKLFNKAFNLYPALIILLTIAWDKEHLDKVEEITGYKLTKLEDRELLRNDAEKLQAKYRELSGDEKGESVSFSQIIIGTELVLERNIDRSIKLFEFVNYMKQASDKIKQLEAARK